MDVHAGDLRTCLLREEFRDAPWFRGKSFVPVIEEEVPFAL